MRLGLVLSIFAALYSTVDASPAILKGRQSNSNGSSGPILTPDFVQFVKNIVEADGIPGLTLAIVHKTGPAEFGAWGIMSENDTKMTTDTLFNIASCSKAFVASSLGIVIDDFAHGRNTTPLPAGLSTLSWKTKVANILPNDWKLMDPWASQKANLIDILSHVSGLSRNEFSYKSNDSLSDVTRNLRNFRLTFELREQYQYNNQMYMVGSYVVSTLSGMRFVDFVNKRIFKPLGMNSSTYSIDAAIRSGKFTDTWTDFGRSIPPWMEAVSVDLAAGPGGVITSVEELAIWTRIFLNGGVDPNTNTTIIPPAEFNVITSGHSIANLNATAQSSTEVYGMGWARLSFLGHNIILHDGGTPGVSTIVAAAPEDGIGIVVLGNADGKGLSLEKIIIRAAEIAFGAGNSSDFTPDTDSITRRRSILPRDSFVESRADSAATSPYLDLAGTYHSMGWGTVVLCSAASSSPSCQSVLDDFRALEESTNSSNSTDFFASFDTFWTKHARFTYTNTSEYLISLGTIYPEGYGKNSTSFSTLVPFTLAQFVVENGKIVGFGFNDSDTSDLTNGGSVEETSQVWFAKEA